MELSFSIAVNSDNTEDELLEYISQHIEGAKRDRGYVQIESNVLKFEKNPDFDVSRCNDVINGWEFYRYDCDVFPVEKTTVERQREVAAKLLEAFNVLGSQVNLLAEFEVQS